MLKKVICNLFDRQRLTNDYNTSFEQIFAGGKNPSKCEYIYKVVHHSLQVMVFFSSKGIIFLSSSPVGFTSLLGAASSSGLRGVSVLGQKIHGRV